MCCGNITKAVNKVMFLHTTKSECVLHASSIISPHYKPLNLQWWFRFCSFHSTIRRGSQLYFSVSPHLPQTPSSNGICKNFTVLFQWKGILSVSLLAIYCAFEMKTKALLQIAPVLKKQSYLGVFYCKEPTTSRIQVFPHEKALEDGGDKKHQLNRKKPL